MYGLRKINNMYTPNGSGRDAIIFFETKFRGGRAGYTQFKRAGGGSTLAQHAEVISPHT